LKYQERNVTMMTELRALTPRHRNEVVALRESYAHFARSRLEDAQDAGAIRCDISARYLSLALLNMLNWAALWFRSDEALSMKELAGIFVKIFFTGAASAPARTAISLPDLASVKRAEPRPRKPRHRDNSTFERLLDAAVALFSRKGYTATSTREVAELVGIQKASIFYHIEDKEDLLYLICKSSLEQIRSDIDIAIREIQDPLERIRTLIRTHIESMLRDRDKHLTTLAEMHALSHQRLAQVVALRDAYENLVRTELHDAQRAAALRDDIDAKYLSLALLGLMNRVLRWYRRNGRLSPAQLGQLFAVIFLTGVQTAADCNAKRSRRGLVMVVTAPPRPQFAGEELPHADFGRNGEVSLPSATACVTAALLFRTLKTWASGSITNLSRNVNTFFKPRSS
jgi:AcrR family transcriptional regulator